MGALSTVKKCIKQYLEQILGFHSLTEIQKIVLASTALILKKSLFKSIANFVRAGYLFIFTIKSFIFLFT